MKSLNIPWIISIFGWIGNGVLVKVVNLVLGRDGRRLVIFGRGVIGRIVVDLSSIFSIGWFLLQVDNKSLHCPLAKQVISLGPSNVYPGGQTIVAFDLYKVPFVNIFALSIIDGRASHSITKTETEIF